MAKKKEPEKVWVVVSSSGYIESFVTLLTASSQAQSYLDINESEEVYIFEVVKAWAVELPEEPYPEVNEIGFEAIP